MATGPSALDECIRRTLSFLDFDLLISLRAEVGGEDAMESSPSINAGNSGEVACAG